jgi:hypothetical protein
MFGQRFKRNRLWLTAVIILLLVVIALPHHLISLAVVAPPCKNCGVTTAASAAPDITVTRLGLGFPYSWAILSKQTSRPTLPPNSGDGPRRTEAERHT